MTRVVRAWRDEEGGEGGLPGGSVREHLALKVQGDQINMAVFFWYLVKSDLYNVHVYTVQ